LFEDQSSVDLSLAGLWLVIAAREGDRGLWEKIKEKIQSTSSPVLRKNLISALSNFRDPTLVKESLSLVLDGYLKAQDFRYLTSAPKETPQTQEALWEWATVNFERLPEIMGDYVQRYAPWFGSGFCSLEGRDKVRQFFSEPGRVLPGTKRNLALVLEYIDRCSRLRGDLTGAIEEYFTR
jgi:aminopeptidase N